MASTKLSVNINKIALIRNSRGGNNPDIIQFAKDCEEFGADGITVHPRPDERHIRYADLPALMEVVTTEFNVEGYPSARFMQEVLAVAPHQATLVPDPPGVLTSNEGWDITKQGAFLKDIIAQLHEKNIRVSLFIEPNPEMCFAAKEVGADRVELYTGHYADEFYNDKEKAIKAYVETAKAAAKAGVGLNAGHDLNLDNLNYFKQNMLGLKEVSIGHALVSDALYYGISNVIKMYQHQLSRT
jgi:pyridoxine 5-phosphate synthase